MKYKLQKTVSTFIAILPLAGLIAALLSGFSVSAQQPAFMPLGADTKMIEPRKQRYPRLFPGTTQIDFFVQGRSLPNILSKNLSTACVLGNFNQIKNKRYYVIVDMPDGRRKKFGFADYTGTNLKDPDNRRGPNQVYLFEKDRTSECKVYAVLTEW